MHGVVMIFFFLIPSIPATLGNFLVPMMIGAKDLAFPRINLLSWYIYIVGGLFALAAIVMGGVDTGWTFYTPFSSTYSNTFVITAAIGVFIAGFSSILTGLNFIVTDPQDARARDDLGPSAALRLGQLRHLADSGAGHAGGCHHAGSGRPGAGFPHRHLRPRHRRRSDSVPAHVLVLFAPGGLHHDSAGMGVISELVTCFSRKGIFGYSLHRRLPAWASRSSASWCGAITCLSPACPCTPACTFRS